jgi:hypothetical protein
MIIRCRRQLQNAVSFVLILVFRKGGGAGAGRALRVACAALPPLYARAQCQRVMRSGWQAPVRPDLIQGRKSVSLPCRRLDKLYSSRAPGKGRLRSKHLDKSQSQRKEPLEMSCMRLWSFILLVVLQTKCFRLWLDGGLSRCACLQGESVPIGIEVEKCRVIHLLEVPKGGERLGLHIAVRVDFPGANIPSSLINQPVHVCSWPGVHPRQRSKCESLQPLCDSEVVPPSNVFQVRIDRPGI